MRESHLRALRAAMRVATVGSLVACGSDRGTTNHPSGGHGNASHGTAYGAPGGDTCAIPTSNAVATAPPPVPTLTEPRRSQGGEPPGARCMQTMNDAAAAARTPAPRVPPTPELVSCCNTQMQDKQAFWDARARGEQVPEPNDDNFWFCCTVQGVKHVSLCSPWGPAMPRAIDDAGAARHAPSSATLDLHAHAAAIALQIDAAPHVRQLAVQTWLARMVNEHGSAIVFEALTEELRAAGFAEAEACAAFAAEERRHGVLCGAVAEALGATARAPALPDRSMPQHPDASTAREAVLRNVLSICCLHETVAVALIGAERHEMEAGPLRHLLTGIWADEIGHARFGWMLLASVADELTTEERAGLGRYLSRALEHLDEHELSHLPIAPDLGHDPSARALGLCSGGEARALYGAVRDQVIQPRLAALGIVPVSIAA